MLELFFCGQQMMRGNLTPVRIFHPPSVCQNPRLTRVRLGRRLSNGRNVPGIWVRHIFSRRAKLLGCLGSPRVRIWSDILVLLEAPSALSGVALIVSGAQDAGQLYEGRTLRITPSVCAYFSADCRMWRKLVNELVAVSAWACRL